MGNTLITGTLELVAVSDGSKFVANMVVAGVAAQSYTQNGTYFPDWSQGSGPSFTPEVYDALLSAITPKPWVAGSNPNSVENGLPIQGWYYNNQLIIWTAGQSGHWTGYITIGQTNYNLFDLDWNDSAHPVMKIIANIPADVSASDNDYIEFRGTVRSGDSSYPAVVGREIKINLLSGGNPFKVEISMPLGNSFDGDSNTDDARYIDVIALLGEQGAVQADSGFVPGSEGATHSGLYKLTRLTDSSSNQLYMIDLSDSIGISQYYYSTSSGATGVSINTPPTQGFYIKPDDVSGECVLVVKLKDNLQNPKKLLATASEKVKDLGDPDTVAFSVTATKDGSSRDTAREVKRGESVEIEMLVTTRAGGTDVSSKYTWLEDSFHVFKSGSTVDIKTAVLTRGFAVDVSNNHASCATNFDKIAQQGGVLFSIQVRD